MPATPVILSITELSSDEGKAKRDAKGEDDDEVPSKPVVSNIDELLEVHAILLQLTPIATNSYQSSPSGDLYIAYP